MHKEHQLHTILTFHQKFGPTCQWFFSRQDLGSSITSFPPLHHGNLSGPPQCHPTQEIAGLFWGTMTHHQWFPLIFGRLLLCAYFLGGGWLWWRWVPSTPLDSHDGPQMETLSKMKGQLGQYWTLGRFSFRFRVVLWSLFCSNSPNWSWCDGGKQAFCWCVCREFLPSWFWWLSFNHFWQRPTYLLYIQLMAEIRLTSWGW